MKPEVENAIKRGMRVGKNCQFISPGPNFGSEPYLITIGDNTTVSFDVAFVTHDAGTRVLRNLAADGTKEKQTVIYGEIKIGNNSFIGCRAPVVSLTAIYRITVSPPGSPAGLYAAWMSIRRSIRMTSYIWSDFRMRGKKAFCSICLGEREKNE